MREIEKVAKECLDKIPKGQASTADLTKICKMVLQLKEPCAKVSNTDPVAILEKGGFGFAARFLKKRLEK